MTARAPLPALPYEPCPDCVSRRDFIARAGGAAAVAAALAACGDGQLSAPLSMHNGGGGGGGFSITVGSFPELAELGKLVAVAGVVAVKRTSTSPDAFVAFDMTCTHQNCRTDVVNAATFSCPCHGSQFDGNGMVTVGPATRPLVQITTSYDVGTDTLTIG